MTEAARLADELVAQAERDDAAAFNAQHALDREAQRVMAAITQAGRERAARIELDRQRDEGAARFDPEDDDAARPASAPRNPGRVPAQDDGEEEEVPERWLR